MHFSTVRNRYVDLNSRLFGYSRLFYLHNDLFYETYQTANPVPGLRLFRAGHSQIVGVRGGKPRASGTARSIHRRRHCHSTMSPPRTVTFTAQTHRRTAPERVRRRNRNPRIRHQTCRITCLVSKQFGAHFK